MKIFVNYLKNSKYQANTDISYPSFFEVLADQNDICVVFNESKFSAFLVDIATRLQLTRLSRINIPLLQRTLRFLSRHIWLFPWQLRDIDVIISFWFFPIILSHRKIPLLFPGSFPANNYVGAVDDKQRAEEIQQLGKWFTQADLVPFPAQSWLDHFNALDNRFREKTIFLPFLLPDLHPVTEYEILQKFHTPAQIKLLFVGRDGNRKGLAELLSALEIIATTMPTIASELFVTIVSETLCLPIVGLTLEHHLALPRQRILELMQESHIFCLPTHHDSYGFVFIEAMATGCAIIADNCDPRTEILEWGNCGILTDTSPNQIADAIIKLVSDISYAQGLALHALQRYKNIYDFSIVKQSYLEHIYALNGDKYQLNLA